MEAIEKAQTDHKLAMANGSTDPTLAAWWTYNPSFNNPYAHASTAAVSHAIGSDSQRPFAIVIVGGLIAALVMSIFLLPTLYVWIANDQDVLPAGNEMFEEEI